VGGGPSSSAAVISAAPSSKSGISPRGSVNLEPTSGGTGEDLDGGEPTDQKTSVSATTDPPSDPRRARDDISGGVGGNQVDFKYFYLRNQFKYSMLHGSESRKPSSEYLKIKNRRIDVTTEELLVGP